MLWRRRLGRRPGRRLRLGGKRVGGKRGRAIDERGSAICSCGADWRGGPAVAYGSAVIELAVNELAVNELAVDELAVDELAVDELAVDELAVNELAVNEGGRSMSVGGR